MPLTNSELQTLRSFFWLPEGKLFVAMLKDKLAESDAKLRRLTGEALNQQQGKSQQLEELIRELSEAEQSLKRQDQSIRALKVALWNQA
jgi:flagellar hook-basal body complex protein FliE